MKNIDILQTLIGQKAPVELSPVGHWLAYTLSSVAPGEVILELTSRSELTNPAGMMHGGILTTLCDDAMGIALFAMDHEHYYVSVDIHINFLYGIPVGEKMTATGKIVRDGKKIAFATCEIHDESGRLCAMATSNRASTSASHPKEYAKT